LTRPQKLRTIFKQFKNEVKLKILIEVYNLCDHNFKLKKVEFDTKDKLKIIAHSPGYNVICQSNQYWVARSFEIRNLLRNKEVANFHNPNSYLADPERVYCDPNSMSPACRL
jgi:hypothetical protein